MIAWYSASVPPDGWLECNGQSTSSYPALAAIVGATVPDLRGQFIRGWSHNASLDNGRIFSSIQKDSGRNITGNLYGVANALYSSGDGVFRATVIGWSNVASGGSSYVENYSIDASRVWGADHIASEFRPSNVSLLPCIKY